MKTKKTLSGIKARNYSATFGYFTKYVELPIWIFEKYENNDLELAKACIDYINNITCNRTIPTEKFELYIKQ